jgi:hypothetical protein
LEGPAAAGCRVFVLRSDATNSTSFPAGAMLLDSLQQVQLDAG